MNAIQPLPALRIARVLAEQTWLGLTCDPLSAGIFRAGSKMHGGFLAVDHPVKPLAGLPREFWRAAHAANLVSIVGVVQSRNSAFATTAQGYTEAVIVDWLERNESRGMQIECRRVAVFERDIDWAALALVRPSIMRHQNWTVEETIDRARDVVETYEHLAPFRALVPRKLVAA